MRKPTICGSSKVYIPTSGCSDCDELEYRIGKLEEWVRSGFISEADIIALTPIECETPSCEDSRACYGEVCCMKVGCETEPSNKVCEGKVCSAKVECATV